ncbi:MAG: PilW family protein [Candidatus Accumulibacter sp.]|jgi:type IV pilus assembly protein PilW|nr:PilW family protein [Accumulibacter sp.]
MRSSSAARRAKSSNRGFSLIEVMVALVIGMIGVLIIMQVARTAEAQKRATTGAGDSQTNGALAMHSVQRDIRQAGYGFSSLSAVGCPLTIPGPGPGREDLALDVLAPVTIIPSDDDAPVPIEDMPKGDIGTDTLFIVYGNSVAPPEGDTIVSVEPLGDRQRVGVTSAANFKNGDWIFVAPPSPEPGCALTLGKAEVHAPTVDVRDASADMGRSLFDLGSPRIVAYAVRNGNLITCDYMQADCNTVDNWTVVANGVVGLRAQYGHDTGSPGDIEAWDQVSPVLSAPSKQERFACAWARISAIRLALVVRSGERQREEVSAALPRWMGGGEDGAPIELTNPDWKHYRYQVYETVMPLRNIPWMGTCLL